MINAQRDLKFTFYLGHIQEKYVFYLLNKLVIEDYDDLNIVVCKNKKQARLLHDKLFEFFNYNGISRGIFMNELSVKNRKRIYKNKTFLKIINDFNFKISFDTVNGIRADLVR